MARRPAFAAGRSLQREARLIERRRRALQARVGMREVHDLRVALRRARALLWSVKPWCRARPYAAMVVALRAATGRLGPTRDIDVAAQWISSRWLLPGRFSAAQCRQIRQALNTAQLRARRRLSLPGPRRSLQSRLQQVQRALQDEALWHESGAPPDSRWRRRIVAGARKCVRRARGGEFAQLHALRIRSKRCRYTLEALGSAAPRRRLAAMTEIHRVLGDYFDACVAAKWLAGAANALPADCRRSLQRLARDDVRVQLRLVTTLLERV